MAAGHGHRQIGHELRLPASHKVVSDFAREGPRQLVQRALRVRDFGSVQSQFNIAIEMRGSGGWVRAGK